MDSRLRAGASEPSLLATDAADYLARRGMPFRQAHDLIGKVLREAERQNKPWTQLSLDDLRRISPVFDNDFHAGVITRTINVSLIPLFDRERVYVTPFGSVSATILSIFCLRLIWWFP